MVGGADLQTRWTRVSGSGHAPNIWKRVVVAFQGMAAGGRMYFINESDIVIASEGATFFDPHAGVGIVSAPEPIGRLHRARRATCCAAPPSATTNGSGPERPWV